VVEATEEAVTAVARAAVTGAVVTEAAVTVAAMAGEARVGVATEEVMGAVAASTSAGADSHHWARGLRRRRSGRPPRGS